MSGPDGDYSFPITSADPLTTLIVATPGFPVKVMKLRVPAPGERADIVVSNVAGTLSIVPSGGGQWPVVFHDGAAVSLALLLLPRAGSGPPPEVHGDRFVIEVEPGEYTVCPVGQRNDLCARRVVPAGGDAFVDLRSR